LSVILGIVEGEACGCLRDKENLPVARQEGEVVLPTNRRDLETHFVLHNCPLIGIVTESLVFQVVSEDLLLGIRGV